MKYHELMDIQVSITDTKALEKLKPEQFANLFDQFSFEVEEIDGEMHAKERFPDAATIIIPLKKDETWVPKIRMAMPLLANALFVSELSVYARLVGLPSKKPRIVIIKNETVKETFVFVDREAEIKELVIQDDAKWYHEVQQPGEYMADIDQMEEAIDEAWETYRPQSGAHGSKNLFFINHLFSILKRMVYQH